MQKRQLEMRFRDSDGKTEEKRTKTINKKSIDEKVLIFQQKNGVFMGDM